MDRVQGIFESLTGYLSTVRGKLAAGTGVAFLTIGGYCFEYLKEISILEAKKDGTSGIRHDTYAIGLVFVLGVLAVGLVTNVLSYLHGEEKERRLKAEAETDKNRKGLQDAQSSREEMNARRETAERRVLELEREKDDLYNLNQRVTEERDTAVEKSKADQSGREEAEQQIAKVEQERDTMQKMLDEEREQRTEDITRLESNNATEKEARELVESDRFRNKQQLEQVQNEMASLNKSHNKVIAEKDQVVELKVEALAERDAEKEKKETIAKQCDQEKRLKDEALAELAENRSLLQEACHERDEYAKLHVQLKEERIEAIWMKLQVETEMDSVKKRLAIMVREAEERNWEVADLQQKSGNGYVYKKAPF